MFSDKVFKISDKLDAEVDSAHLGKHFFSAAASNAINQFVETFIRFFWSVYVDG